MSEEFAVAVTWLEGPQGDPLEQSTFGEITITVSGEVATTVEDLFARSVRPGVRGGAYELAVWFAENWWRLRWEPETKAIDWRLSHVVAAVGGGVAWPDITFASDGVHVLVHARDTSFGKGAPVRYLRAVDANIRAPTFEAGIGEFIELVLARLSSLRVAEADLNACWKRTVAERQDPLCSADRRLEALLGFDPDEAPDELVAALQADSVVAGRGAVDEIAAAAKARASETLRDAMDRARSSDVRIRVQSVDDIVAQFRAPPVDLPWQRARSAARLVRSVWGIDPGPVPDVKLSDVLSVPASVFTRILPNPLALAVGLRTNHGTNDLSVVMRSRVPAGRRFELMRLVGDHIAAADDDRLLPVTAASTDRQKFQRAFAQEFLIPFEELSERLGRPRQGEADIEDDDIEEIAKQYEVSPLVIRTVLVNRGLLPREVLVNAGARE